VKVRSSKEARHARTERCRPGAGRCLDDAPSSDALVRGVLAAAAGLYLATGSLVVTIVGVIAAVVVAVFAAKAG